MPNRRKFLGESAHVCAGVVAGAATTVNASQETSTTQKFLLVGLVGSENPTRANFPFVWAAALRQAQHEVRIELAGDATVLMRTAVSNSVTPVGWPPFSQALAKVIDLKIPIYVWQACATARGVAESDLQGKNAQFTNPKLTAETMTWATKILVVWIRLIHWKMAQPHSYLKLEGDGLTIIPIPPFEISRSSELEIPLVVKREGSSIVIRPDSDRVDSELVELSMGPDEPWRLVTSLYTLSWPKDFAIVSSPTPDVPPGFDLVGPDESLIYLQGPFASDRVKHGEQLAAPGQK